MPDSECIRLTPKLAEKPLETPIKYQFVFKEFDEPTSETELFKNENIYTDEIFDYATLVADSDLTKALAAGVTYPPETLITTGSSVNDFVLYKVGTDGIPVDVTEDYSDHVVLVDTLDVVSLPLNSSAFSVTLSNYVTSKLPSGVTRAYSLITINNVLYIMRNSDAAIIGDYESLINNENAGMSISAVVKSICQPSYDTDGSVIASQTPSGLIEISSGYFAYITLEELVDYINNHKALSRFFTAALTKYGLEYKDNFVTVSATDLANELPTFIDTSDSYSNIDREVTWNYNLYIPYRTTDNFARQLAQHCTYTELKTAPAFGVIGCKKMISTGLKDIAQKVSSLVTNKNFDNIYAKTDYGRNMFDNKNEPYPIGRNLNVVFDQHPVTLTDYNYIYTATGAAAYAGMVSTLPIDQSSTAQSINVESINLTLTESQLSRLTQRGIVTFRDSYTKGIVVTDGVTMAPADSVFRRLNISRITGAVEEIIRAAAEPFIGKQNHAANRNALNTAIKSNMDKIVGTLIETYTFVMNTDPAILKFNYIDISYEIIPIYEIREVRNTIKITDNLTQTQ